MMLFVQHAEEQVNLTVITDDPPKKPALAAEVLVVGSDDWAIGDAASQLREAGRTVHRCSDSAEAPFPCNALVPGRGCPLDLHEVDVVLNIRSRPESQPALGEMGAICGLRDGLPLVVGGLSDMSSFSPWADKVPPTGDIVATCDEAVGKDS
ncbi:MAG TPA: hypothetical protein VFV02_06565 [Acidimicrobiales bacterium]|nr:hypothetical protein [Acidimicrobiales bacterium]